MDLAPAVAAADHAPAAAQVGDLAEAANDKVDKSDFHRPLVAWRLSMRPFSIV